MQRINGGMRGDDAEISYLINRLLKRKEMKVIRDDARWL